MIPNQKKCWKCYEQFQEDGIFNYDCPQYNSTTILMNRDFGDKCPWIDVIEQDIKRLKNGHAYLIQFSIVRKKHRQYRQSIERVVT